MSATPPEPSVYGSDDAGPQPGHAYTSTPRCAVASWTSEAIASVCPSLDSLNASAEVTSGAANEASAEAPGTSRSRVPTGVPSATAPAADPARLSTCPQPSVPVASGEDVVPWNATTPCAPTAQRPAASAPKPPRLETAVVTSCRANVVDWRSTSVSVAPLDARNARVRGVPMAVPEGPSVATGAAAPSAYTSTEPRLVPAHTYLPPPPSTPTAGTVRSWSWVAAGE